MRTQSYPTDLTDEEWAILEPVLTRALYGRKRKRIGPPRQYPLRGILNAILYILVGGCPWRLLPHDLPPRGRPCITTFGAGSSGASGNKACRG